MPAAVWQELKCALAQELEPEDQAAWIEPLAMVGLEDGVLELGCPNGFHFQWVRDKFLARLNRLGIGMGLSRVELKGGSAATSAPVQMALPRMNLFAPSLNRRYQFANFIQGKSNELACAAAKALAKEQRFFSNSLFLVSGTGLGKSHLSQAVGHHVLSHNPDVRVAYLTAEDFTNQMISALHKKRMEEFKDRFRRHCDVLLLEGIEFLAGKDKTQDELGYTLDALWDAGKRVVLTGAVPPSQVRGLKSQLASRLSGGMTVPIDPPDHETRVRILEHLAAQENLIIDREVLELVAQEVTQDVRRLQSALVGVMAKSSLTGYSPTPLMAREVLGQIQVRRQAISCEQIRDLVARVYGMPVAELVGKSRRRAVSRPRGMAMFLCRRHCEASFASIGKVFNRDHTTVIYGVDQVDRQLSHDPKTKQELRFLEQQLGVS